MFNKTIEIAVAWITAANPTIKEKELAEKRYEICKGCDYFGKSRPITGDEYCIDCSCPISKKIFTQKFDACPQHFWLEAEKPYYKDITSKKTLF